MTKIQIVATKNHKICRSSFIKKVILASSVTAAVTFVILVVVGIRYNNAVDDNSVRHSFLLQFSGGGVVELDQSNPFLQQLQQRGATTMAQGTLTKLAPKQEIHPPASTSTNTTAMLYASRTPCNLGCLLHSGEGRGLLQRSTCSKFYPKRYMEQGPGRPYMNIYHHDVNQTYSKDGTQWSLLPGRLVVFTLKKKTKGAATDTTQAAAATTTTPSTFVVNRTDCTVWHKMVFVHLHKCGGSTMNSMVRGHNPNIFPYSIKPWLHFQEVRWSTTSFTQRTKHIMQNVVGAKHHPNTAAMAFSYVRDPVTRFLSGVGQIFINQDFDPLFPNCSGNQSMNSSVVSMTTTIAAAAPPPPTTSTPVVPTNDHKRTTNAMLDCVITTMQKQKSFLNEHLEPQTFELYRGVHELDIPVLLLDLSTWLSELVQVAGMNATTRRRSVVEQKYQHGNGIHGYEHYWFHPSILTSTVLQRICHLYEMDVRLLQITGVAPTLCALDGAAGQL